MKTKETKIQRAIVVGSLISIAVLVSILIYNYRNQVESLYVKNIDLKTTLEKRDSLVNDLANTFQEIEQNLTFVRNRRGNMTISKNEGFNDQRKAMVADIKLMNEMLIESSKKIEELEKRLKESGLEIKSFRNKIAQLNKIIEEQNTNIKQLSEDLEQRNLMITERDTKITKLNSEIISKNDTIQAKSAIIEEKIYVITEKDNELNKAFFTSGTANQLVKNGVLIKEGGFLGIAKNKVISENFSENSFTQLDIRSISQLPINAKKAKLISVHPDNSYQMIEENDKIAYLKIENPEEFWKLTRFVIVETK